MHKLDNFLHNFDTLLFTVFGVSLYQVDHLLGTLAVTLSITYTILKIRKEFFNNKKK